MTIVAESFAFFFCLFYGLRAVNVARYAGASGVRREIDTVNSGHCVPTVDYGVSPCSATGAPYLNHCGVDGMGDALRWLLPNRKLVRNASGFNPTRLIWFDQRPFFWGTDGPSGMGPSPGLADAGALCVIARPSHATRGSQSSLLLLACRFS